MLRYINAEFIDSVKADQYNLKTLPARVKPTLVVYLKKIIYKILFTLNQHVITQFSLFFKTPRKISPKTDFIDEYSIQPMFNVKKIMK